MSNDGACPCPVDPSSGLIPSIGVVEIDINECYAIGQHWDVNEAHRTAIGDLVYRAKTFAQGKRGDLEAAIELGRCLGWWAAHLRDNTRSRISEASVVCSVPANPPKRPYHLPDVLAPFVSSALDLPCDLALVRKVRPTAAVKLTVGASEKRFLLADAFEVRRGLDGETVVVVDDVVLSGVTLEAIGGALRGAGAARVIAIVGTKAKKGLVG